MPWFLFLIAAAATAVASWRSRRRVTGLVVAAVLAGLAVLCWPGRRYVERMLTDLALPIGLIWLALLATIAGLAVRRRWWLAGWVGLIWLALSAAGNGKVTGLLTESLERPYFGVDPLEQGEFDAVVLLGGGAGTDRNGTTRVGDSGDRVVVAARLYHAGKTPLLVCTGGDLRTAPNLPSVAEESAGVLADLGVPRGDVLLGPGYNTKTEAAAIRRLKDEHGWGRIGIVTSAWHMPRVDRLARGVGLSFVPLPADFRSGAEADRPFWDEFRRFSFIPKAGSLDRTHAMLRENLARLAGR